MRCYTVFVALNPDNPHGYFNRGRVYARRKQWKEARHDFDSVIALRADLTEAYAQRAAAAREQGDYRAAERDLTRALELDGSQTRSYFLRAKVRAKAGDLPGAQRDREEGMRRQPNDAAGWLERGIARLPEGPKEALADFERALQLDRRYFPAWQNKAHVLSEHLGQTTAAVKATDQAVALQPDFAPAQMGRGVLLARLGKRTEAHRDAREALKIDNSPLMLYQAANIYALTSRTNVGDRAEALRLLARALAGGFGLEVIDEDTDMDPIRKHADFNRIVKAARELREGANKKSP